jgi:hypothetical protein
MHNQDDVGSFIVQWRGARLITDPGAGRYTRDYFRGPEQPISKSSATHSVPVINGLSQAGGKTAAASDVRYLHDEHGDGLSMQLAGVYPLEARLRSLLRTVRLDRSADPGAVELTDTFAFDDQPGTCESVLISLHEPKQETPGRVILTDPGADAALAVTFDPGRVEARIDSLGEIPYSRGTWRLWRIVLTTPNPSRQGEIKARIEPQTA